MAAQNAPNTVNIGIMALCFKCKIMKLLCAICWAFGSGPNQRGFACKDGWAARLYAALWLNG
jgi:hypothetical protein